MEVERYMQATRCRHGGPIERCTFCLYDMVVERESKLAALQRENAELLKRLKFVIEHGAVIMPHGDPAHSYSLSWAPKSIEPHWRYTSAHKDWSDAIDEAMREVGCE